MREQCINCNSWDSQTRCCFCHAHDRFEPKDEIKVIMLEEEIEELKELHESDKESLQLIFDKANEQIDKLNLQNQRLNELKKQNEELKADKKYLDNVNNEQTEVILKLNKQIEQ